MSLREVDEATNLFDADLKRSDPHENRIETHVWAYLERVLETIKSRESLGGKRSQWSALIFGQLIALVAASQNAASFTLEYGLGRVFPFFLMLHTYIILSVHLFFTKTSSNDEAFHKIPLLPIRLRTPWWYYLCLSMLDVGPNYLTLLALNHTSLTSATLLGSLTVPSTMLVCHLLLGKVFRLPHFLGAALCLSGGILTVWNDIVTVDGQPSTMPALHPHSYFGDILALIAAILYGIGDAAGEFWSKHVDRKEYLGMLGFFGTFFCIVLVFCFETEAIADLFHDKSTTAVAVMFWYIPSLVAFYVSATLFLVHSDATLLILSLQSSNLWVACFSALVFRETPSLMFYLAVGLVFSGVFVYELLGNSSAPSKQESELVDSQTSYGSINIPGKV